MRIHLVSRWVIIGVIAVSAAACGARDDRGAAIDGHVDCENPLFITLESGGPAGGGDSAKAAVIEALPQLNDMGVEEHWYGHVTGVVGDREVISATAAPEQDGRWYINDYMICPTD
jgi:hypothetical protein